MGAASRGSVKLLPIDPFDGEKVCSEVCVLVGIVAMGLRIRWQSCQPPRRQDRPKPSRARRRHATEAAVR